jgi:uncharacterized protein (TIRG00374 family)
VGVGLALAAVLLYLFLRGVDWPSLREAFSRARPAWLAAVVLASVATYAIRAWRWGRLLRPLTASTFRPLFSATLVGFLSGFVVPRAGEVLRPYLVARRYGVKMSAAFASIIIERLLDLVTVAALFAAYLFLLAGPELVRPGVQQRVVWLKAAGGLAGLGAVALLGLLLLFHLYAERTLALVEPWLAWLPARLAALVARLLASFAEGLAVLQASAREWAILWAQSLLLWLCIAAGFHAANLAFSLTLAPAASFLLLAFLTVGVSAPTPGFVGGFHGAYRLALSEVFGVEASLAAAVGIAAHAFTSLPVLVLGTWFLGAEGLSLRAAATMAGSEAGPRGGSR